MNNHGKGPKFVFVQGYWRWVDGELQPVNAYVRGLTPPLSLRQSPLQLDFGF
jgi:hypothetical protein